MTPSSDAGRCFSTHGRVDAVSAGAVRVVDSCSVNEPRSKDFVKILKALEVRGPTLVVVEGLDRNLSLASRNVARVEVVTGTDLNAFQLARYPQIIVTKAALAQVAARLGGKQEAGE